jgi:hypothetical protein
MEATKLTKEIYKNYLKIWKELKITHDCYQINKDSSHEYYFADEFICISDSSHDELSIIPFYMLYALLEEFFYSNNIIIDIYPSRSFKNPWTFNIYDQNINKIFFIHQAEVLDFQFENKDMAKYQAIIKACEILEERLK